MVAANGRTLLRRVGVLAVLALGGCSGSDGGTEPVTPKATTLSLTPASVTLTYVGATTSIVAKILDQNGGPLTGTVTWASDDPAVASVNTIGVVKAEGNGSTTIRAASGSLSATFSVTVQQAVSSLTVVSGDAQSAIAGESLSEEVAVRALDVGGAPIEGLTVTFTPAEGAGTVSATSATTDTDGKASTVWTLGDGFGPQELTASTAAGISRVFKASSLSPVPLPDLVTDATLLVDRTDLTTLETLDVQASVRNDGDAGTGQGFRVRLMVDGAEIESVNVAAMAPSASKTFNFTVGPFAQGAHSLVFQVDPDAAVEELIESNNTLSRDVSVALQTAISAPSTTSGIGATTDVELLYRLDLPGAANNLTIELSGGTGDVDLFVEKGERPAAREQYNDCQSGNPTTVERCQLVGVTAGTYHILLHAFSTFSGTTMTISLDGEVLPYNIEVVFVDHGTAVQDAAFIEAAERWMSLITVDVPDSDFSTQPYAADKCLAGQPEVSGVVDDLRIYVSIDSIDGPSGTLAQATACVYRGLGNLPILGYMQFDEADMQALETNGELISVVQHEMGHVLGLGTIWVASDYFKNPSMPSSSGVDTHFEGPRAIAAFDAAGGTSYTGGAKVPVENTAESGSADGHWRESVLKKELMTPFFNRGSANPLSAISVQAMGDLGYQVDASQADPFTGVFSAPSPAAGVGLNAPVLDLTGDVPRRPMVMVDQKGRVVKVIPR